MTVIDPEKVLSSLKIITDIDLESEENALALCSHAASQLNQKLRSPLYGDDARVISAAAALALTFKVRKDTLSSDGFSSFKAGDVSVSTDNSKEEISRSLFKEALAAAAPCLIDDNFLFTEV